MAGSRPGFSAGLPRRQPPAQVASVPSRLIRDGPWASAWATHHLLAIDGHDEWSQAKGIGPRRGSDRRSSAARLLERDDWETVARRERPGLIDVEGDVDQPVRPVALVSFVLRDGTGSRSRGWSVRTSRQLALTGRPSKRLRHHVLRGARAVRLRFEFATLGRKSCCSVKCHRWRRRLCWGIAWSTLPSCRPVEVAWAVRGSWRSAFLGSAGAYSTSVWMRRRTVSDRCSNTLTLRSSME